MNKERVEFMKQLLKDVNFEFVESLGTEALKELGRMAAQSGCGMENPFDPNTVEFDQFYGSYATNKEEIAKAAKIARNGEVSIALPLKSKRHQRHDTCGHINNYSVTR